MRIWIPLESFPLQKGTRMNEIPSSLTQPCCFLPLIPFSRTFSTQQGPTFRGRSRDNPQDLLYLVHRWCSRKKRLSKQHLSQNTANAPHVHTLSVTTNRNRTEVGLNQAYIFLYLLFASPTLIYLLESILGDFSNINAQQVWTINWITFGNHETDKHETERRFILLKV